MTDSFSMDMGIFKEDARKLRLLSDEALPAAVEYTLNELAVQTWKRSKRDLKDNFTIRNTWTARNMAFEKVTPGRRDISRMRSMAGSRLEYMREQQEGVKHVKRGKHGVPIPTAFASGETENPSVGKARLKKVQRKFYLSRLRVGRGIYQAAKTRYGGQPVSSRKQHYAIVLSMARKRNLRFVYWESRRGRKGLYKIRDPRDRDDWVIQMVYDLSKAMTTAAPREWLTTATDEATASIRKIYGKALFFQLRKLGAR